MSIDLALVARGIYHGIVGEKFERDGAIRMAVDNFR